MKLPEESLMKAFVN